MDFFNNTEIKITKKFLEKGYIISKSENIKSLRFIKELVIKYSSKILKKKKINLNEIHKYLKIENKIKQRNKYTMVKVKVIISAKNIGYPNNIMSLFHLIFC